MKTFDRLLLASGLLIPFWLLIGVALTAQAYPGYSHLQQAMSQLGAVDAPTHSSRHGSTTSPWHCCSPCSPGAWRDVGGNPGWRS
jgi:hypothetical protein